MSIQLSSWSDLWFPNQWKRSLTLTGHLKGTEFLGDPRVHFKGIIFPFMRHQAGWLPCQGSSAQLFSNSFLLGCEGGRVSSDACTPIYTCTQALSQPYTSINVRQPNLALQPVSFLVLLTPVFVWCVMLITSSVTVKLPPTGRTLSHITL